MKAPQLTGPKIIGRIELPAAGDSGEKRSRKRIPLGKRPETGGGNRPAAGAAGAGGSTPQYGRDGRPRTTGGATTIGGRTGGPGGARPGRPGQPGEVDQKEIQRKIQETQARLAGGRPGRGQKAKYRRDKRDSAAEKRAMDNIGEGNVVQVTEFISVSEFANLLNVCQPAWCILCGRYLEVYGSGHHGVHQPAPRCGSH
jgi:translation initiation factor IF-2